MPSFQCPNCGRTTRVQRREDAPYRPFCSRRCQMIDLYHWFEGDYRISDPLVPDPDAPAQRPPSPPEDPGDP